jgi:hypothetical protein
MDMRNRPFKSFVWICLCIPSLSGCAKRNPDKNCSGKDMEELVTFYQGEFSDRACFVQAIDEGDPVQNRVINNTTDYIKYIQCGLAAPDIDFDKYVVLATRYKHNQCAVLSGQKVEVCNKERIIFTVEISEQDCSAPASLFGFAVVEKKNNTLPVEFNTNLKKE